MKKQNSILKKLMKINILYKLRGWIYGNVTRENQNT